MEWSLRFMRANSVMGIWHETHLLPGLSASCQVWMVGLFTCAAWQGMHASFVLSFSLNL